jgi:hypothetical protein
MYRMIMQLWGSNPRLRGALVVLTGTLLVGGCTSLDAVPGAARAHDPPTVLEVFNYQRQDVNIYAVRSGTRVRLGTAPSLQRSTFKLPEWAVGADGLIRLGAAPLGSQRTMVTEGILVRQGDRIEWALSSSLARSYYSVRPR